MRLILLEVATLLFAAGTASKFLDFWLRPVAKARLLRRVNDLSSALKQSHALVVIKSPLEMASTVLDRIYGIRLLSCKAFRRSAILSITLMLFSLSISGIASGVPFGIRQPPWSTLSQTFDFIEQAKKELAKNKPHIPEADARLREYEKILQFRTWQGQTIYSIGFFALVIAAAVFSNFVCVALARKTLRDIAHATTLFTLFSLSLINFVFAFLLYASCISVICTASLPFLWVIPPLLILCAIYWSWLLAASIAPPLVVAALQFSPQWMKIVSVVATLPGILVLLASLLALLAFPFRRVIRNVIVEWLSRAAESDKGVLAFAAATFTLLGVLVSLIPKVLFGSLGLS